MKSKIKATETAARASSSCVIGVKMAFKPKVK